MRRVLAVGSGKGGVGKSTVSVNLALALAAQGHAVGLLDADLHGPNVPLMLGITKHRWSESWTLARAGRRRLLAPVERHGVKIASAGFILGEDQPFLADALSATTLIRQLLDDVAWGELDFLVADLPPGTGDIQQVMVQAIPLAGALVVVTPQYVAHLDARKAVRMFQRHRVPVLGSIENMGALRCPHCGEPIELFPRVPAERSLQALGVEPLGSIPFDPAIARAGDSGRAPVVDRPDSAPARVFGEIAAGLVRTLGQAP